MVETTIAHMARIVITDRDIATKFNTYLKSKGYTTRFRYACQPNRSVEIRCNTQFTTLQMMADSFIAGSVSQRSHHRVGCNH